MDDVWDKDLLHVTYHPGKINLEQMQATIRKEEFTPTIRNEGAPPADDNAAQGDEHGK